MTLNAQVGTFAGFFIQARAENNQTSQTSIVGTWESKVFEARTVQCNGNIGVSPHVYFIVLLCSL